MTLTRRRPARHAAAVLALALASTAIGVAVVDAPMPAQAAYPDSFNPFSMSGGFTIYAREDALLRNQETEGSIAVGGVATVQGSSGTYTIIHVAAGTGDYTLPTVDGDPTRFLVGQYSTSSTGILAITSAGTSDPALHGDLKMVQRDGPWQPFGRADWIRLNTNPSNVDQTPLIDATSQRYPASASPPVGAVGGGSIYTADTSASAVADYVEAAREADYEQAAQCLAGLDTSGYPVGVAEDAGARVVLEPLSADRPNVVEYADIAGTALIQFSPGPTPGASNPLIIQVPAGTTEVIGARADPQGQYSPYIFWDLSQVTGDVAVTAAEARIDGSVYAPEATVTVTASPLDGQVLGENVIIGGGEVHSFLFAGEIACEAADTGTFEVQKALSGIADDELPPGTTFTVDYTATLPDATVESGSVILAADGTPAGPGTDFPAGTVVTFDEIDPASVPGWEWGDATISPETITIGAGTTATVTVTNTATEQLGGFTLQKQVVSTAGEAPAFPDGSAVSVDWTATFGGEEIADGQTDVPLDGTVVTPTDGGDPVALPIGTVVTLAEVDVPDAPAGYRWVDATWTPDDTVTIDDTETPIAVQVTNTLAPEESDRVIAVTKSAIGDAADPAYQYAISYNTDPAPARTSRDLVVGDVQVLDDVETDAATLELAEQLPMLDGAAVDPDDWELPVITYRVGDGPPVVVSPGGFEDPGDPASLATAIVSIPIGGDNAGEDIAIQVTNALRQGTFAASKEFARISGDNLPTGLTFPLAWTAVTPAGEETGGVLALPLDGTPVSPLGGADDVQEFPYGTVVTLEELAPPSVTGIEWESSEISPATLVIGADGEAVVSATVTNTARLRTGTFQVQKELNGIPPGALLVDSFTVEYEALIPGQGVQTGSFDVAADGTPTGPTDGDGAPLQFPLASVILLTEVTPAEGALPPGYEWGTTTWSPRSFVVARADQNTIVEMTNTVEQQTRYALVKTVDGDAADLVPDDVVYPVDWWLDYEPQSQLGLEPNVVLTSPYFPVGSIVEAREATPPDVPGVEWGTPVFYADGQALVPEPDGRVVLPSASVRRMNTVVLRLSNDAGLEATSAFTVAKSVTGQAAAAVPDDEEFTIEYTVDGGEVQTATLRAGESLSVTGVPADATLRIREAGPADVEGVLWGTPTWSADGTPLTPDPDGWVTVDLAASTTLAFTLVNAAEAPLPNTGGTWSPVITTVGLAALLLGVALLLRRRRMSVA